MVTTKKILAWLCAAAMVLSAMAMPVFAEDGVIENVTQNQSYDTIAAALAEAETGDEIFIGAGTYTEEIVLPAISLTIKGAADHAAVLTGGLTIAQGVLPDGYTLTVDGLKFTGKGVQLTGWGQTSNLKNAAAVVFQNNLFEEVYTDLPYAGDDAVNLAALHINAGTDDPVNNLTVANNSFLTIGNQANAGDSELSQSAAVYFTATGSVSITDNTFENINANAVTAIFADSAEAPKISGNTFRNWAIRGNAGRAMRISYAPDGTVISENTFQSSTVPEEIIKATETAGSMDLTNNYWNGAAPVLGSGSGYILIEGGWAADNTAVYPCYADPERTQTVLGSGIATVGGIGYTDLQEAVNAAQGTENAVEITSSIIQGTQVDITGAVIINGSGNMITADGTDTIFNLAAANAALTMNNLTITGVVPVTLGMDGQEVYLNDSAIQVVSRDGAYSRGIRMTNQDIVQDIVIRLNHSKILYTSDTVTDYETQTYIGDARGISLFSAQNSKVTLEKNSEISGFGYSINLTGAVDDETKTADMSGLRINVTNSLIRGWTAFNIWGSNAQFNIYDSTLKGINVSNGPSDSFAVIVVNDDLYGYNKGFHAENNTFDIQRTEITNYQGGTAEENLFRIDAFAGVQSISMRDVTFTDTTGNVGAAIYNLSMNAEELEAFISEKVTTSNVTVTGKDGQELPLTPARVASVDEEGKTYYFGSVGTAVGWMLPGEVVKVLDDSVEPERIVITEPISIVGAKADGTKPKISGAISVKLADGETAPVTISGLEIEHTGVYSADAAQDQKCALAVINGGLIAEDNYIHILTPVAENVSNSPSAMQLAKNATNTAETVYRVSGNTFGYYGQWSEQSGTTAGAVFAPVNYDGVYGEIDVDANAIYQNNVFEDLNGIGSNFLFSIYDYTAGGYRYSAVGSLTGLQDALDAQAPQCTIVLDQEIDGAEAAIAAAAVNPTTTIFYQDDVSGANVTSTADNGEVQISVPGILFDAAVDTDEAQARYYPVIESRGTEIRTDGGQTTAVYTADISIVKEADGTITQVPAANQKVTVALPAAWTLQQGEAAAVYHVTASGREAIDGVTTDGNLVTFIAPSFSEYEFEVALDALAPNTSEAAARAELVLDAVPAESDAFTKVYTLSVQSAEEGKVIAGLTDLAFTANFDKNGTNTTCRIEGANDYAAANSSNGWQLSLSDKSDAMLALKTGEKVVVGKVTFTGYTYDGDTEVSATLSLSDITGAYTAAGDVQGSLTITDPAEFTYTNRTATQTITAVISFPNKIQANDAPYQDMTVLIQGSTGQRYEIQLGENLLTDTAGGVYYQIEQEVPAGGRYSVSVSGAGYRTAVKSVTMNQDQTVYFWNNYSDTEGANFLAGDILMDNVIDLYDLNAAVSYFGETNLQDGRQDYAQYDLNRDGKIDSRDVAMVLVSWGK